VFTVWVVFHVIVSVALIIVVLMQSSKGDGLAGTAFSGSLSGAVFGGRGAATFLSKATTVLAIIFMFNCGALAFMSSQGRQAVNPSEVTESTVTRKMAEEQEKMMRQQQEMLQRQQQDSIARANQQTTPLEIPGLGDTTAAQNAGTTGTGE
jgi:protein translocase SecG subunit